MSGAPRQIAALTAALVLTSAFSLAAVGPAGAADSSEVTIGQRVEPAEIRVAVGDAVTWRNADNQRHRVRSASGPDKLDSGNLEAGEHWSHVFAAAGTYVYLDHRNDDDPAYRGVVVVEAATAGVSPGEASRPPRDDRGSAGPSPQTGESAPPPSAASSSVAIAERSFVPAALRVAAGATVTWTNQSGRDHTVTAADGSFDSGVLPEGASYRQQFTEPGTYDYVCLLHSDMRGTVEVTGTAPDAPDEPGAGGESAPPAAPQESPPAPIPPESPLGQPGGAGPAGGGGSPESIDVRDFSFDPAQTSVPVGTEVTWTVSGSSPHTVTAETGAFDSGLLSPGQTFAHTFDEPGSVRYVCSFHPEMTGVVEVTAEDSASADGAARASPAAGVAAVPASDASDAAGHGRTVAVTMGAVGVVAATLGLLRWRRAAEA